MAVIMEHVVDAQCWGKWGQSWHEHGGSGSPVAGGCRLLRLLLPDLMGVGGGDGMQ